MNTVKEKLMKLLRGSNCPDGRTGSWMDCNGCKYESCPDCYTERNADHLIQNGVTIQEWVSVDNDDQKVVKKSDWEAFYKEHTKDIDIYGHYDNGYIDALDAVDDWFDVQTSLQDADKWVSVDERLPDIGGMPVLMVAVNEFGQQAIVKGFTNYFSSSGFLTNEKEYDLIWDAWKVTHWMPLPAPPKGVQ